MAELLLVDDELALTDSLGWVLGQEGYGVTITSDGATGYDLAIAQP